MAILQVVPAPLIDWHIITQIGWLTLLGLLVHFLDKWDSARRKCDFTWKIFWDQNLVGYVISFILCFIGLTLIGNGIELVPGNTKIVIAVALGYGGGEMVRSVMKKITPIEVTQPES